jgi:hypothetical protein
VNVRCRKVPAAYHSTWLANAACICVCKLPWGHRYIVCSCHAVCPLSCGPMQQLHQHHMHRNTNGMCEQRCTLLSSFYSVGPATKMHTVHCSHLIARSRRLPWRCLLHSRKASGATAAARPAPHRLKSKPTCFIDRAAQQLCVSVPTVGHPVSVDKYNADACVRWCQGSCQW